MAGEVGVNKEGGNKPDRVGTLVPEPCALGDEGIPALGVVGIATAGERVST